MIGILFLLFTVVPITEIYLLIQVGKVIGAGETIWLVILTGVLGAWAAKSQGQMVWGQLNKQLQQGQMPADTMIQGLLIFVGGLLLITPGIMTDALGFSLVMPPFRYLYVGYFKNWIAKKVQSGNFRVYTQGPGGGVHFHGQSEGWEEDYGPRVTRDVGPDRIGGADVIDIDSGQSRKDD